MSTVSHSVDILKIIADLTKRKQISLEDRLVEDLYIDSITYLELLSFLEETFFFELDLDDLEPGKLQKVQDVVALVEQKRKTVSL
ncbi:acyl carrier protein [Fictibacillus norfolkensis]|jgi:acyl carrier protein|uniref:Acyl carrier protein n=1 Tax=Fictibacillus norfolkensis TaxID=2762233 RepID=A0ABR8SH09_9BACL|nr:acyl carrier protein [Fictibacillus norfolkensis]MBD7962757.1 acyl carrier protein [Fictibacillus norfolkensis]